MDELATRATLLMRLRETDPSPRELAWRDFHARYAPVIAGFARKMGAKPGDVEDLVQDVLTGFFEAQPRFAYDPAKGRFRGYLKTVTWRTYIRRRGKHRTVSVDAVDPNEFAAEPAWDEVWKREQLNHAIELVRKQYDNNATFRSFELLTQKGLPLERVAHELRMTIESVYKAKQRITKAIREKVKLLAAEEG